MVKDMSGQRFGRLVVIDRAGTHISRSGRKGEAEWNCHCDCGKDVVVRGSSLRRGFTQSCGCYQIDRTVQSHTTHGKYHTKLYAIWDSMKQRCYNSSHHAYTLYGGRGVIMDDSWRYDYLSFEQWALANGYTDGLSIDRIDVDGNYTPDNCRWVNMKVQQNNKRNNVVLSYNNETHTLAEWSDILGIPHGTLWRRLHKGWSVDKTLSTPVQQNKSHPKNLNIKPVVR